MLRNVLTRTALLNGVTKARQPIVNQAKRAFSSGSSASAGTMLGVGAMGVGITGLSYLSYMGHQQRKYATPEM
jgi:hypothetical protein